MLTSIVKEQLSFGKVASLKSNVAPQACNDKLNHLSQEEAMHFMPSTGMTVKQHANESRKGTI